MTNLTDRLRFLASGQDDIHSVAIAEAADEIERLTEGVGAWRPIATAPIDGTWLLLAGGNCDGDEGDNGGRPVVAQWTNYLNGRTAPSYGRWQFAWYDGGYYGTYNAPARWMPLPEDWDEHIGDTRKDAT